MPKTENISLNVTFNTETRDLTINTNGTPPEVFEMATMVLAQLVPVFTSLDTELRRTRDETRIVVPQPKRIVSLV